METQSENEARITVFRNDQLQVSFQIDIPNGFYSAKVNGQLIDQQNISLASDETTAKLEFLLEEIQSGAPDTLVVTDKSLNSAYFTIHPVYEIGLNPEDIAAGSWQKAHFGELPKGVTLRQLIGTADKSVLGIAGGAIYKGTNNGSWKIVIGGLDQFSWVVRHPSNDLYAAGSYGGNGWGPFFSMLYKSTDNGETWSEETTNLPWDNAYYGAIAISKEGTIQMYVGDNNGSLSGIWRNEDGMTWSLSSNFFDDQYSIIVESLVVVNDSTTFVLGHGWEEPMLMIHSSNYGKTWKTTFLPAGSFESLLYSSNGDFYIFSHDSGVFVSGNQGETWKEIKTGLPENDIRINAMIEGADGRIYIAPQNYGVFTLEGDRWKSVGTELAPYDVSNCFAVDETIFAMIQPSGIYKLD
ncbi:MAG TPA: sialidase family protein [Cyclobacteriaceae bacterium]|nr:sialidase family protein [Cyclobacteriaceae bacterium]